MNLTLRVLLNSITYALAVCEIDLTMLLYHEGSEERRRNLHDFVYCIHPTPTLAIFTCHCPACSAYLDAVRLDSRLQLSSFTLTPSTNRKSTKQSSHSQVPYIFRDRTPRCIQLVQSLLILLEQSSELTVLQAQNAMQLPRVASPAAHAELYVYQDPDLCHRSCTDISRRAALTEANRIMPGR